MATHANSNAFQPPRKEKSKTGVNNSTGPLILEVSDSAGNRASGAGKNRSKTWGAAPKRGDVKAAILKDFVDATRGLFCTSPTSTRDADVFLGSVPSPKKSQPMAKVWPLMDAPVLPE